MVMITGRRKMCEIYTEAGMDVFSYRFETRRWGDTELEVVQNFDNMAFSFRNTSS